MLDSYTLYMLSGKFVIGLLLFIRVMSMMAAAPFFGNPGIINQVKVLLSVLISITLTGAFWKEQPEINFHVWYLVLLVMKEILIGIALGFSTNLVFHAARFAGGMIDFDMGYQTALMFDSDSDTPTLVGEFKFLIVLMVFFIINGHHFLIEGLFASVRAVPIDTMQFSESSVKIIMKMATTILVIGIKIAAPVLVALFLTNLSLTLLARVAPQTNIFQLSFSVKIIVGILVLFVSVPLFVMVSKYAMQEMQTEAMKLIMSLNPARAS
ncbi:MAG: flagellar biosynthetic protein FliR [Candidatus Kapabacteria bacterium]|nr:flagellar biosynthetic protein FliR [Candidatus Kapabacteria bacterium]